MISWAQNFEDVLLARAFAGRTQGFYVDIGAYDPSDASVTRHFYEIGWRGINVEPQAEPFARLAAMRPEDVNLRAAIGRENGTLTIWHGATSGESSARRPAGSTASFVVPALTLAELFRRHVTRPVDFLKIDVEGLELDVIEGGDWERDRPAIVVVEVTKPWSSERRDDAARIAERLVAARYDEAWFDGLNAYFVAREAAHLAARLALPPNVLDRFVTAEQARLATALGATEARAERAEQEAARAASAIDARLEAALSGWKTSAAALEEAHVGMASLQQAMTAAEQRASALTASLAERDRRVDELVAERDRWAAAHDALRTRSEEAAAKIQALRSALAILVPRAAEAARLAGVGMTQAARIAELDAALTETQTDAARMHQQAHERAVQLERLQGEAEALFARLGEASAWSSHWQARAAHAEAAVVAMEHSRSWRLTAPLRMLRRGRSSAEATTREVTVRGDAGLHIARTMSAVRRSPWFARIAPVVRERFPGAWLLAKRYVAEKSVAARPPAVAPPAPPPPVTLPHASSEEPVDFAMRLADEVRRQRGQR